MTKVLVDGVEQDITPAPLCSRCTSFSYLLHRNKKGALVCHRCVNKRAVHKADMPDEVRIQPRGMNPEWEDE